jgi:phosphoglycerate dehydrogenase-like enzyme
MISDNSAGLDEMAVGVVGLGSIGLAVANAFHRMGSTIIYYDPQFQEFPETDNMGALAMPLADVLKMSDVVRLHMPFVPKTQGLIGDAEIASMEGEAILINAARGGVVDEEALAKHLISGHLGGAAVYVYSSEPPGTDNPLLSLTGDAASRVLFTRHIAGVTRQPWAKLFQWAWDNVETVLSGGEPNIRVY